MCASDLDKNVCVPPDERLSRYDPGSAINRRFASTIVAAYVSWKRYRLSPVDLQPWPAVDLRELVFYSGNNSERNALSSRIALLEGRAAAASNCLRKFLSRVWARGMPRVRPSYRLPHNSASEAEVGVASIGKIVRRLRCGVAGILRLAGSEQFESLVLVQ